MDSEGRRGKTTKQLMYKALLETGNSGYYEDINLICHVYWGWLLPDIEHLEDRIMHDYDVTQRIYNEIPKDRRSSLNSQFRLYVHLLRYQKEISFPIRAKDFKIPTTRDILEWHYSIWSEIVRQAWPKSSDGSTSAAGTGTGLMEVIDTEDLDMDEDNDFEE